MPYPPVAGPLRSAEILRPEKNFLTLKQFFGLIRKTSTPLRYGNTGKCIKEQKL